MNLQLPADSLFNANRPAAPQSIADIPAELKAQIEDEAIRATFHRMEASLRLLLAATTPGNQPDSPELYQKILSVFKFELENRVNLKPDVEPGSVMRFDPGLQQAYIIQGRCAPGDMLRVRVPCWRLKDRIVLRGELEKLVEAPVVSPGAAAVAPQQSASVPLTMEALAADPLFNEPEAPAPAIEGGDLGSALERSLRSVKEPW